MAGNIVPSDYGPLAPAEPGTAVALPDERGLGPVDLEGTGGGPSLGRYVAAVKRYKWVVLGLTLFGTAVGIVATKFIHPVYSAQATVYIQPTSEDPRSGPIRPDELLHSQQWVELLFQYRVLDSVIKKERLYLEYAPKYDGLFRGFTLADRFLPGDLELEVDGARRTWSLRTQEGLNVDAGRIGDSVGTRAGYRWRPSAQALLANRKVKFSVLSPREASVALQKRITPNMTDNGSFLRVSLTGDDPAKVTTTLNTLIDQFVAVAADLKKYNLRETSKILSYQVDTLAQQLHDAEGRLESYKTKIITEPTEGTAVAPGIAATQPTVMTQYFNEKMQADALRRDRESLDRIIQRARAGSLAVDEFQTVTAVQSAPDLQNALSELAKYEAEARALGFRYTPEAKQLQDVQEKVKTLRSQTIPAYATALSNALRAKEGELNSHITTASRDLQAIPGRTINEQRLEREYQQLASLYGDVAVRYQQAKLAEASAVPDVRLLDAAIPPQRPTRNSAPVIIGLAFLGSMALAVGIAILLDRLDKRLRYPDQVTRELGLSILGAIPAIRKVAISDRDPEEASQVVEAFRTIRMNLAHSYGAAGPVMLTVSSPSPGDGKSLVSSNLALSFAEAGYKTLLIDGDVRRGELHRMFGTDRRPGLIDVLLGTAKADDVLRPASHRNLTLIPCGTRHHHAPELLGSAAMRELLVELKGRYNAIIVDSPPLGAGIDPFVLGTATGNMLLVLRSGETDRKMAEAKLKLLDKLPVRILGAVLNDISAADTAYKYYHYVYGYTADEESAPQLNAAAEVGEHG
jgi:capsular exopolysaccharide synthesis family protein